MGVPSLEDVHAAHTRIRQYIHQTPVFRSASIDAMVGAELLFKCENFQKTGAFKARGAANAVLQLRIPADGFATHSSGNHGAALAWATGLVGSTATVVTPETTLPEKLESMERYGARLIFCESTLESREWRLEALLNEGEYHEIPPYDHFDIVAGQGTCALEFLEQTDPLDQLWIPVGGGGLAAGSAIAVNGAVEIYCAEPELARDAYDSLSVGKRLPPYPPATIADGLCAGLGSLNFETLRSHDAKVVLASEDAIRHATTLLWSCLKLVVEPSSAVVLAAMLEHPGKAHGRVGVILSGGNMRPELPSRKRKRITDHSTEG